MKPRKDETPEEFRARQRKRYANDPVYRERILEGLRKRRRQRYANDPVYREWLLERQRKRYATDPEYRQTIVERERKRYARKRERQREIWERITLNATCADPAQSAQPRERRLLPILRHVEGKARGRNRITDNRRVRSWSFAPLRRRPADRDCKRCPVGSRKIGEFSGTVQSIGHTVVPGKRQSLHRVPCGTERSIWSRLCSPRSHPGRTERIAEPRRSIARRSRAGYALKPADTLPEMASGEGTGPPFFNQPICLIGADAGQQRVSVEPQPGALTSIRLAPAYPSR